MFALQRLLHRFFSEKTFTAQKHSHTEFFIHRRINTEPFTKKTLYILVIFTNRPFLHTDGFAQKAFTEDRFYRQAFTQRLFHTQTLLTNKRLYTQTLLHTKTHGFTHRQFHTNPFSRNIFTYKHFLQTNGFSPDAFAQILLYRTIWTQSFLLCTQIIFRHRLAWQPD